MIQPCTAQHWGHNIEIAEWYSKESTGAPGEWIYVNMNIYEDVYMISRNVYECVYDI